MVHHVPVHDLSSLVAPLAAGATAPFGSYVFAGTDPRSELGRALEREVFFETFGNTPELLDAEYSRYDDASVFLCVVDHVRRRPAGAIRIILDSPAGLKSLDDIAAGPWGRPVGAVLDTVRDATGDALDPGGAWDLATLSVERSYRGGATQGLVSLALYQMLGSLSVRLGVRWWVTILDVVVLDLVQKFGAPLRHYKGLGPLTYLGSPSSVPLWADMVDWYRRIQVDDPAMCELLADGRGLEASVTPPAWDDAVRTFRSVSRTVELDQPPADASAIAPARAGR